MRAPALFTVALTSLALPALADDDASGAPPPTATETTDAPAAKPARRPSHVLTANVPSNVFGAYSVEYIHAIGDHLALFAEPTFFGPSVIPGMKLAINGPGLVMGAMIHPFGEAPDGLFLAPEWYVTYVDALEDSDGYKPGLGAGGVAGWTFRFFDHLVLSAGLGATVNLLGTNLAGGYGFGFLPVLRLNVGAAL